MAAAVLGSWVKPILDAGQALSEEERELLQDSQQESELARVPAPKPCGVFGRLRESCALETPQVHPGSISQY